MFSSVVMLSGLECLTGNDLGAIIPKIEVRDYIPDPSLPEQPPNPITLHIYPGKDQVSLPKPDWTP